MKPRAATSGYRAFACLGERSDSFTMGRSPDTVGALAYASMRQRGSDRSSDLPRSR